MPDPIADLAAERAFLGTLMVMSFADGPGAALQALQESRVTPDRLFLPAHQDVLAAAQGLLDEGQQLDGVLLSAKLKASTSVKAAGGPAFLADLEGEGVTSVLLPSYAQTIRAMSLRRLLASIAGDLAASAMDPMRDPGEVIAATSRKLAGINLGARSRKTMLDAIEECITEMEEVEAGRGTRLIPTGIIALDNVIAGLRPTLYVVGARPGVGKSSVLATIATSCAQNKIKFGVFSLEDAHKWIAWRALARESSISQLTLETRPLSDWQRKRLVVSVARLNAYAGNVVIESNLRAPAEIIQAMRDMVRNEGVKVVALDHIGRLKLSAGKERFDLVLGDAVNSFADAAIELGVPVILFSQLARRQGKDEGDLPESTDFKNSGDIEAAARVLIGLARKRGSDTMQMRVLKNTKGNVSDSFDVRFLGLAGMVADCEGVVREDQYSSQGEAEAEQRRGDWQDSAERSA